jgi:site-specific DNA-methyltransferase (adenine-specific)
MLELNRVHQGDCLELMKEIDDNSIDAIVTDPPYGLSFMGKKWDYDVPNQEIWQECLRVLKPGGYLLAFAGTRTQHRMAVRIEDAGFEIRDMIAWVYGSGFPKSLNVGKAVDKLQGNEREDLGANNNQRLNKPDIDVYEAGIRGKEARLTKGTSEWEGWGTALKPALEPITVARKPLSEKTVAENCLKWGVGGINIDGCRVEHNEPEVITNRTVPKSSGEKMGMFAENGKLASPNQMGRFPANLIHDGSDEVVSLFPNTKSGGGDRNSKGKTDLFNGFGNTGVERPFPASEGSASRFFYCAKSSKSERNRGCDVLEEKDYTGSPIIKWLDNNHYIISNIK